MSTVTLDQALYIALQHHQAGRLAEAEGIYRQILAHDPNFPPALHLLGALAGQVGQIDTAIDLIRRAIAQSPHDAGFHSNLGRFLTDKKQFDEAIVECREAIRLNPQFSDAYHNLAIALGSIGRHDEAAVAFRHVVRARPDQPEAHDNLGIALRAAGEFNEAIACFRKALALKPDYAEAYFNLGSALYDIKQFDPAIAALREALRIKPDYAEAHNNLGNSLKDTCRLDEAFASYREAQKLRPDLAEIQSNMLGIHFHPGCDAQAIREEGRKWNRLFAEPLKESRRPQPNDRNPNRLLRIGYISPDFREHCQSFFTIPLLSSHNRDQFHVTCYADVRGAGAITRRIQSYTSAWRNITLLPDERVADLIRDDKIDILIDLTMHMHGNRLLVMARKPAPIQVTWLAYPGTTGLEAIDYRLTDVHLDPPGEHDADYAETSIRLPDTFWCYDPLTTEPAVNAPPSQRNGYVTFGCLNNFCKVNDGVLALWSQVLSAVKDSRMLILAAEGSHRQRTLDVFNAHGVAPERIEFAAPRPRMAYLELYHQIDIGLDTLPYNGHTTSLDSFWMGVPVVTLVGHTVVGRAGLCQLKNLGLPELIAHTPEAFVEIATKLARDESRLSTLRSTLRARMQQSPLMDAPRFARNVEAAYRQIWRKWCEAPAR